MNQRQLDPAQGIKPLDFGAGGITGSVNQEGRLIALNAYHPKHGYFTLTSAPPFPEHERYNPAAVRAYRRSLAQEDGFSITFGKVIRSEISLLEDVIPCHRLILEKDRSVEVITFNPEDHLADCITMYKLGEGVIFGGWFSDISLQRCAYTQLTEGGVIPIPALHSEIYWDLDYLTLQNLALRAEVRIRGTFPPRNHPEAEYFVHYEGDDIVDTVRPDGRRSFDWSRPTIPSSQRNFVYAFELQSYPIHRQRNIEPVSEPEARDLLEKTLEKWRVRWQNIPDDLILRRGLSYSLMCCVPIEDDATCILTDHMLLPLSWNRDAYYAALALLHWKIPEATEQVRRHLIWMFEKAERLDDHFWGRSYLANGRIKDRGFQLDQQLFPLLELADYVSMTGDQDTLSRLQKQIEPLLGALLARKADHAALFPTDETPADDPIAYPYHFSSHLLFWVMLKRLDSVLQSVGTDPRVCPPDLNEHTGTPGTQDEQKTDKHMGLSLQQLRAEIEQTIQQHFIADRDGKRLYSYATDGKDHHHFYQDANDIPVALAPAWGFCAADDPIWRATVEFAFSPENKGGYYGGRLGSVHTPAAWPLGDVQDLIIARTIGDSARIQNTLHHIQQAAQWDGALPEAYDPETGEVVSRHWFVWPNAAYACTMLGAFDL